MNSSVVPPGGRAIRKDDLHRILARAAQVRSVVTMVTFVVGIFVGGGVSAVVGEVVGDIPEWVTSIVLGLCAIAMPVLVAWLMTVAYCRPNVKCPQCEKSLWDCGTGNFKPRRMRVRPDVTECPHCGMPIR
jgi:hypothetical protein